MSNLYILISSMIGYGISLYLGWTHQISIGVMVGYALINIAGFVYAGFEITKPTSIDRRISRPDTA